MQCTIGIRNHVTTFWRPLFLLGKNKVSFCSSEVFRHGMSLAFTIFLLGFTISTSDYFYQLKDWSEV